jgi:hypothetical protein
MVRRGKKVNPVLEERISPCFAAEILTTVKFSDEDPYNASVKSKLKIFEISAKVMTPRSLSKALENISLWHALLISLFHYKPLLVRNIEKASADRLAPMENYQLLNAYHLQFWPIACDHRVIPILLWTSTEWSQSYAWWTLNS